MNNSIEDIMIDKNLNNKNKKGKSGIVFGIILLLILALVGSGYTYYKNVLKPTNKELFFKALLNTDVSFVTKNEIYEQMVKKFVSNNFEMNNNLTFSEIKNEELEASNQDYSKYLLNLKTIRNVSDEKTYNELNLSYSDNNLINVKIIDDKEKVAIFSQEIFDKYVGIQKNNVKEFLNKMNMKISVDNYTDLEKIFSSEKIDFDDGTKKSKIKKYTDSLLGLLVEEKFTNLEKKVLSEKIDFDDDTKKSKTKEYTDFLLGLLPEEKFTIQENLFSLVKENSEEVTVQAYKLSLTKEDYISIVTQVLNKLKNDEELLAKFVTNENTEESFSTSDVFDDYFNIKDETLEFENFIFNFILGRKVKVTIEDVQTAIDNIIKNLSVEENGLEITIYVSEVTTEKISVILPNKSTIDIEINSQAENQKKAVVTYLYEEKYITFNENETAVYSAGENEIPQNSITKTQTNGIKLEISKVQNDASTNIEVICNFIENKQINQKISLDITTKGTATSKNLNNEIIFKNSNLDGEFELNIKNKINFDKVFEIENLSEENCLLLDTISDEELSNIITAINTKAQEVYTNKKQSLNFIDTNTQTPGITQNNVNREVLRNLLVTIVSMQMGEAISIGQEYTINDLLNLKIPGHFIYVSIENDIAQISVDGVKFNIDSNFNLSDAE